MTPKKHINDFLARSEPWASSKYLCVYVFFFPWICSPKGPKERSRNWTFGGGGGVDFSDPLHDWFEVVGVFWDISRLLGFGPRDSLSQVHGISTLVGGHLNKYDAWWYDVVVIFRFELSVRPRFKHQQSFTRPWWHVSPYHSASDPTSRKFRSDTVRLPSAPWAHESQRFVVTRIAAWNCLVRDKWGKKNWPRFRKACVFDVSWAIGISQDSDPYPNRNRIARYNATKHPTSLEEAKVSQEEDAQSISSHMPTEWPTYWPLLQSLFIWGNPKGPLFKGASFKTQVDRLPTATRTCKWPALWRLHLQMGFATTEPCSALDWLSKARGWRVTTALGNPFPCRKVCFAQEAPLDRPPLRLPDHWIKSGADHPQMAPTLAFLLRPKQPFTGVSGSKSTSLKKKVFWGSANKSPKIF